MLHDFSRQFKEKGPTPFLVSAQVYGGNTTHNLLNQAVSRFWLADFCATLRESIGNAENFLCISRVALEAQS